MTESGNLKQLAAKGLFWSALERFGAQGIQFIFGLMITRILMPEDYGMVGMILIFMAIGQTLVDSGFGASLIWKKEPSEIDYSTVFYFNIAISVFLYLIFFLIAPIIAGIYNEPHLTNLIRIICLNFIILSSSLIQQVILQKHVNFKLLAYINIAGSFIAGVVSLYAALKNLGPWAIVLQILVKSLFSSVLLWIFNKWRPLFVFSRLSLKNLFGYGSKLAAAGLIFTVFQYFYFNVIGKLFPLSSLGYYTRAVQLQEFPVRTISSIFSRVSFPVLSSIHEDDERLKNAVGKTLRTLAFVIFPVMFGLISVADPLIEVALTAKWLPASGFLKLLCIIGLFYPFQVIHYEIIKAKGKASWVLNMEIITKIVLIVNIIITYRWGITAIIYGQIVTAIFTYGIGSTYVSNLINYSVWKQLKDIGIYLVLSAAMLLMVLAIQGFFSNRVLALISMISTGMILYLSLSWFLKLEEIKELKKLFRFY